MTAVRYLALIAVVLLAPGLCVAQPFSGGQPPGLQRAEPGNQTRMYEDVEIMRRLLNRQLAGVQAGNCTSCHVALHSILDRSPSLLLDGRRTGGTAFLDFDGTSVDFLVHHSLQGRGHEALAEGVYVPGAGVVYQVILPAELQHFHALPAQQKVKELSDWDKVRKELHGEKVPAFKSTEPHQFRLEDVLLKVLANNGHRFSQLPPTEKITIAITFRGPAGAGQPNKLGRMGLFSDGNTGGSGMMPGAGGPPGGSGVMPPGMMAVPPGTGTGLFGKGTGSTGLTASSQGTNQTTDLELLGDMYVKQGHYQTAIRSYEKALVHHPEKKAVLYRKLAQAYLKEPNNDGVLQKAIEFLKKAQEAGTTKSTPAKSPLPTRLLISVEKRALDMAGDGKMDFETFRRMARVEWLRFPLSEGKKAALLPADGIHLIRINSGQFRIPINVQENQRQNLEEIRLLTSRNGGKTWKVVRSVAATEDSIPLTAMKSGEVWLGLQLVHKNGRIEPASMDLVQPAMKILVEGRD